MRKDETSYKQSIDIILVTCNRINFLKQCIESLEERLVTPYRLIIINNNSQDGTTEYLKELKNRAKYNIKLIYNTEQPRLSGCYSQGLKYVNSKYFICLQDDIIIPKMKPDVLSRLIKLLENNFDKYTAISLRKPNMYLKWNGDITRSKTVGAGFRIHKTEEWKNIGFGNRRWETLATRENANKIGKYLGVATNIWLKDLGHTKNRGYPKWFIDSAKNRRGWEWIDRPPRGL